MSVLVAIGYLIKKNDWSRSAGFITDIFNIRMSLYRLKYMYAQCKLYYLILSEHVDEIFKVINY